jgi:hypothetical protein
MVLKCETIRKEVIVILPCILSGIQVGSLRKMAKMSVILDHK